jgi:TrmH family RNA methyltransferase
LIASKSYFEQIVDATVYKQVETVTVVEDRVFKTLCTTTSSCGILATAKILPSSLDQLLKKTSGAIVFGECIQDPGNLGTIIRTALAFGAAGLVLSTGSVDFLSPKVVRGSMGAVFSLPIVADQNIAECLSLFRAQGRRIIALDAEARTSFDSSMEDMSANVYLFGNEGQGLSQEALRLTDQVVSIPINPLSESLNVAVAVGIVLYHANKKGAGGGDFSR